MNFFKTFIEILINLFTKNQINKNTLLQQNDIKLPVEIKNESDKVMNEENKVKPFISQTQFKKLFPKGRIELISSLNELMKQYDINTFDRVSMFLAQCGHESAEFKTFKENLNYSKKALLAVFGKYFTESSAAKYERNPEMIANRVYANRMNNGNEESKDGWKYRGRGLIQLTGKENYEKFSKFCNKSLEDTISYCETDEGIVLSAIFFWNNNKCNIFADSNDFVALTKKINGGTNGLTNRKKILEKIKEEIKENFS